MREATLVQVVEEARDAREAADMLVGLTEQDGYRGGRLLQPSCKCPRWQVQAFFDDEAPAGFDWLPDGCRRVLKQYALRLLGR